MPRPAGLKNAILVALAKGRKPDRTKFLTLSEQWADFKITGARRAEFGESLACWKTNALVPHHRVLTQLPYKAMTSWAPSDPTKPRGKRTAGGWKDAVLLQWITLFDKEKAKQLWEADFVETGKKALRKLLIEQPEPEVKVVRDELSRLGICGSRYHLTTRKAGLA